MYISQEILTQSKVHKYEDIELMKEVRRVAKLYHSECTSWHTYQSAGSSNGSNMYMATRMLLENTDLSKIRMRMKHMIQHHLGKFKIHVHKKTIYHLQKALH